VAAYPELVVPGVYRVDAFVLSNSINVLLLENDDGWTLVDTGMANSVGRIRDAITALGSGPEDLKRIFFTHQHDDHTGGAQGLLEWAPHAEVGASPHEAEVISGRRPKDGFSNPVLQFLTRNVELPTVPVGKVLREGDLVSGFRIIPTPGHSLGHVSLLRDAEGLLFTADAFGCFAAQDPGGNTQGCLHRPGAGETLSGEAARRRLFDRDLRPRKDPARESEGPATRGRRQVQVLGG
jgi:glyoxylase-like metal-dependent hydrolase (beta-lactamase superfamily II)